MDTVTIKIDKEVKKVAQKQARREGVSLANLFASRITTFFTSTYLNNDFEPKEQLNAKTREMLVKEMKEIREGKNMSPGFDDVEDAIAYLKNL